MNSSVTFEASLFSSKSGCRIAQAAYSSLKATHCSNDSRGGLETKPASSRSSKSFELLLVTGDFHFVVQFFGSVPHKYLVHFRGLQVDSGMFNDALDIPEVFDHPMRQVLLQCVQFQCD
jgi:hypothetical protein